MEYWNNGILEYWNNGIMEYWNNGILSLLRKVQRSFKHLIVNNLVSLLIFKPLIYSYI